MTDNSASMVIGLSLIYETWRRFRKGKKSSNAIISFEYDLEGNLMRLTRDLASGKYVHGGYIYREVQDPKRRLIAVAEVRDRVVHRLIYDYLVERVDWRFDPDVYSCRVGKGLLVAITRVRELLETYDGGWVWRADIRKCFDSVEHDRLMMILREYKLAEKVGELTEKVVRSYGERGRGIAIGNLTSQVLVNVYLDKFDKWVRRLPGVLGYVRYGDDFVMIGVRREDVAKWRELARMFLRDELGLEVNEKNDVVVKARAGVVFLGAKIFKSGTAIKTASWERMLGKTEMWNMGGYDGLVRNLGSEKQKELWFWHKLRVEEGEEFDGEV